MLLVALAHGASASDSISVIAGSVFSSAQASSQSFLRFTNTGATEGTVSVRLFASATGQPLGQWTSPSVPAGAELQFPIAALEAGLGQNAAKPDTYTLSLLAGISGYFQHVLYRPADGTLTNLSTCAAGGAADITAPATRVSGVHSSLLSGFPSTVIVNNTGAVATAVTLGIYDARDGSKRGTHTTALVPAGAEFRVPVTTIEATVGGPTAGMLHYIVKVESPFTGFVQHLVDNTHAGVITDMTAACALSGVVGVKRTSPASTGIIYATAQSGAQSFLRFLNSGSTDGVVTATVREASTGMTLGQWTSPRLPANAEQQFSVAAIESALALPPGKAEFYVVSLQSGISGSFQHVLWRPADGTLTNLSTCAFGVSADTITLSGVHSSLLQTGFPSTVAVTNTASAAASATLGIYDARDGTKRGTYATAPIPANGQALVTIAAIEAAIGPPSAGMYHYVVRVEGPFTGFLQHLVNNVQAGVTTDMTTSCAIGVAPATNALTPAAFGRFGMACQPGQTALDGFLLICSDAHTFRYALPEDLPPAPAGGYTARPSWYPELATMFPADNAPACPADNRVTFASPLVPLDQLSDTTPQGAMVADHVTPIDHGYIGIKSLSKPFGTLTESDYVPVYAPGDGEVIQIYSLGSPTSNGIRIAHGCNVYSVIMVLNRLSGVLATYKDELAAKGSVSPHFRVKAGDILGEQRDNPLDFAVNDGAVWLPGYVSPFAYAEGEAWKPYTANALGYFTPDLAAALAATVQRTAEPRWGKIDQDLAGTAAGNWFLDGTLGYSGRNASVFRDATVEIPGGQLAGKNYPSWSHLAIVRHWQLPANWVFSIGWWKDDKGDPVQLGLEIATGQPEPAALAADSGAAVYRLHFMNNANDSRGLLGTVAGIVAIQTNEDETLTIEPIVGEQDPARFQGFSSAKRIYRR